MPHRNLMFTMMYHHKESTFLYVTVTCDANDMLKSCLYRKSTAGNSLLHASSFHPKPLLRSIPYSQYLRIRRNCSDETSFQQKELELRARLLERGYTPTCLKKAYKKAISNSRNKLLYGPQITKKTG